VRQKISYLLSMLLPFDGEEPSPKQLRNNVCVRLRFSVVVGTHDDVVDRSGIREAQTASLQCQSEKVNTDIEMTLTDPKRR